MPNVRHVRLEHEPELVKEFVKEVLRTEAPVQGLFRRAVANEVNGGAKLPADSTIMVHYGAANREESRFDDTDVFDLDRPKKGAHIAFGSVLPS